LPATSFRRIGLLEKGAQVAGQDDEDRTVFRPGSTAPGGGTSVPPSHTNVPPSQASTAFPGTSVPTTSFGGYAPVAPRTGENGIQIGDVLNHIFAVKRFIARGGMGEVFEGENVNTEERVAIKVILPALAADPSIQAMFRKEARTLTRLSHPALVQYRVLAQEPQLGVFYIVTEYVDGPQLSERLTSLHATPQALLSLTRRLAEGLRAAHTLGAIHRDIAPDNVLLESGQLDRARIIDFGIAKDLDPGSKTIVGDGFAGKLGYVAPEQLGDFDKEVGPWTDVYSLGLVILAAALGREPGLGGGFVEAIDRRRRGVDLSEAPAEIRPILARMLVANPLDRLRSMDEVLGEIDEIVRAPAAPKPARATEAAKKAPPPPATRPTQDAQPKSKLGLIIGGGVGALVLLGVGGYFVLGSSGPSGTATNTGTPVAAATAADPAAKTSALIKGQLPTLPCTWLDLVSVQGPATGLDAKLAGVAGRPAETQASLVKSASAAGLALASLDLSDVAPISGSECGAIDAFRAVRSQGPTQLSVPQRKFEMAKLPDDSEYKGQVGARVPVDLQLMPGEDFALYGLEPSGEISAIIPNRKAFDSMPKGGTIVDLGGGHYRLQADANHSGWSGIVMLTGKGGFNDALIVGKAGTRGADWPQKFAAVASANGWKSEMIWFRMVDELPN
jgi:serine/threonine-protein kinase